MPHRILAIIPSRADLFLLNALPHNRRQRRQVRVTRDSKRRLHGVLAIDVGKVLIEGMPEREMAMESNRFIAARLVLCGGECARDPEEVVDVADQHVEGVDEGCRVVVADGRGVDVEGGFVGGDDAGGAGEGCWGGG